MTPLKNGLSSQLPIHETSLRSMYLVIINTDIFQPHKVYRNACPKYFCDHQAKQATSLPAVDSQPSCALLEVANYAVERE